MPNTYPVTSTLDGNPSSYYLTKQRNKGELLAVQQIGNLHPPGGLTDLTPRGAMY